jgi:hypothetical protein
MPELFFPLSCGYTDVLDGANRHLVLPDTHFADESVCHEKIQPLYGHILSEPFGKSFRQL